MGMIDIGSKKVTQREAIVQGKIYLKPSVIRAIKSKKIPKGNVLETARVAGTLAAKKTSDTLPLCHPIPIEYVEIEFVLRKDHIKITVEVRGATKTGMEMEAFNAVAVSALTIYDMCKSLDRGASIEGIRLIKKSGGKSGTFIYGKN